MPQKLACHIYKLSLALWGRTDSHFKSGPSPTWKTSECCLHTGSGEFQEWDSSSPSSPPSPTSCHNVKRYQIGQILLITPHHHDTTTSPSKVEWKYWQVFRNITVTIVWYFVKESYMKEHNVVTAAALIIQESTKTEKLWVEEQLLWVQTPTLTVLRYVQTEKWREPLDKDGKIWNRDQIWQIPLHCN